MVTSEKVLEVLRTVQEPELHQDIVTLKMVEDIQILDGRVSLKIILTTPACPLKGKIENDIVSAVKSLQGVREVNVTMDARVQSDGRSREIAALPIKNAVAVASGKGGVGKSTVAVNLAVALAMTGARVGLMDADIYGPNIPTMMGVDHLPAPSKNKLQPAMAYGIKLMSIGFLVRPGQPLIWRGPMLNSAIRQFLADVDWGELDYLIIDLPPGTGDAQLSLMQSLPLSGGLIVTLPQQVSVEDANRGLAMFKEMNVPVLGVIENMSYLELQDGSKYDLFGQGGGEKMAQAAGVPFLGAIPIDPQVRIGGDTGKPIVNEEPESSIAKIFVELSQKVAAQISIQAFKNISAN